MKKKHCVVCDELIDEDETMCPYCGCLQDEPCSDQMSDDDEE